MHDLDPTKAIRLTLAISTMRWFYTGKQLTDDEMYELYCELT